MAVNLELGHPDPLAPGADADAEAAQLLVEEDCILLASGRVSPLIVALVSFMATGDLWERYGKPLSADPGLRTHASESASGRNQP